jgi:uncharacterized RDD family membrane protein YckC
MNGNEQETTAARPDRVTVYGDVPGRLVAYAVDAVVLSVLMFAGLVVVGAILGPTVRFSQPTDVLRLRLTVVYERAVLDAVVAAAISLVYFVGSWLGLGGSPGQRLLGMRLRAASGSARLSVGPALVRWIAFAAPPAAAAILGIVVPGLRASFALVVLVWQLILLLTTIASASKQGVHDRLAGSIVTRTARPVVSNTDARA